MIQQEKRLLCFIGTRPEAIKMAPIIRRFQALPGIECKVISTGQHGEVLEPILSSLEIGVDTDLQVMRHDQSLSGLTARLLATVDELLEKEQPALVLAEGDTTSVLSISLACFYRKIPFAHVEAGLRTYDLETPFPEEANRVLVGRLAQLHFAPTRTARDNLLREGVAGQHIFLVGNTGIDALLEMCRRSPSLGVAVPDDKRIVLITAHRRENLGEPIRMICEAVEELAERHPDVRFLWPLHPNPTVQSIVRSRLGANSRVVLCDPLPYDQFVAAMLRSSLILTDSGGIQEEAPAIGKPVLVLREKSERPEALHAGVSRLIGTSRSRMVAEVERLLCDRQWYEEMSRGASPYGDGRAAERIVAIVGKFLDLPLDSADPPLAEFSPDERPRP